MVQGPRQRQLCVCVRLVYVCARKKSRARVRLNWSCASRIPRFDGGVSHNIERAPMVGCHTVLSVLRSWGVTQY